MRTGQVDVASNGAANTVPAIRAAGVNVLKNSGPVIGLIFLDRNGTIVKPLGDARVRQALNYAVNRRKIATALFGPEAVTTSNEDQGRILPRRWENYYTYNPSRARTLLAQAGYRNGFKFRVFTTGAWAGASSFGPLCNAIAQDLAAVGVEMEVVATATQPLFVAALTSRTYSAWGIQIGVSSTWQFYVALLKKGEFLADQHGWQDPVIDRLWLRAQRAPERTAEQLWQQLDQRVITQAYFLPVLRQPRYTFVSKRVGGVRAGTSAYDVSPMITWFPRGT